MIKKLTIVSGFLITWIFMFGQLPVFNFEKYTTANGLSDNNTNAILQDSHGFLWIGSNNGLTRFDGRVFKQYSISGKNGITDPGISTLAEDSEGNIWIGTGNGLNKLNPFTESVTHYYEGVGAGTIPYKWCNYLYVDKNKNLWLASEKGIACYDKKENSFYNYKIAVYGADAKINKFIYRVLEDSKNRFWMTTSFGVKLFDRKTKTYQSFHFKEPALENVTISLFEDSKAGIWVGTWGGGLLKYNAKKNIFEKIVIENPPDKNLIVTEISEAHTGDYLSLLVIVNGALYLLEQKDNKYYLELAKICAQNKKNHFLKEYNFTNLLNDLQQNIWASSSNGLYKMRPVDLAFQTIPVNNNNAFIYHVIPDIKNPETVFYLSSQEGWWKYNTLDKNITTQTLPLGENSLLKNINAWCTDGKGYWFTSVKGFGYYDIYNNRLADYSFIIKERSGQENTGFIARDSLGKLWVTMRRSGILVYDPGTKKSDVLFADTAKVDNTFGRSITDLKYHSNGNIYCCAVNKLYKINAVDHSYKVIRIPASGEAVDEGRIAPDKICITHDNRILVSSKMLIYELKNDSLKTIFPLSGLSSFTIEKLTADVSGNIWVSTSKGVFKTDGTFKKWINISAVTAKESESLLEINTSRPGEIIFNGNGQIGILKDSLLPKTMAPPIVIINRIKYGELQNYLVSVKPVTIRSSYKDAIEIELSAIDFVHAKENKIVYKLDGWDNDWKEITGSAIVRYDQLPPDDYTFKTKNVNTEGAESKETIMHFSVIPPFYRTWWFISLAGLLIAAILYMLYRYRLQKALEMERLRTRIATDLHDDIGATLSSISMYSQAVKNQLKEQNPQLENILDKMGQNSRDMVASMSDIVWAINPDNDDGEKLIKRMESYATDMCAVKNIVLRFNADQKLNNLLLPLEHRKNIYLIFKEAINNAVKYSNAQTILVNITLQHKSLAMSIKDNGLGFNEATTKKGNGLKNMQARSKEIKGTFAIETIEGKGTTVCLQCII